MNAELIAPRRASLAGPAVQALMRVRLSTRVLMLTVSALVGAVLYLVLNWPGRQAPVIVSIISQPATVVAPAPAVIPSAVVRPVGAGGVGSLIVDAARGVAAAAYLPLSGRASSPLPAPPSVVSAASASSTENVTSHSSASASAAEADGPVAAVSVAPARHTSATTSASRLVPDTADVATGLPTVAAGTNHIVVPTAVAAASGPNRILVPTAQSAR